jgi:aspartyl-tRNA(Asn)/glutamyl-tRNA(Gln) amidotransferase subunit C
MEKKDILHLATLSRIRISDEEAEALKGDIESVLEYVGAINEIVADGQDLKKVGPVHNVFRADVVTNEEGAYTQALLAEAPKSKDGYLQVKKILQMD